ncbi:hypothetical protein AURDEDRAFT_129629 [Auricularia subglabra TFB-10046 SS5]|nr:hypothetical protein AURDEDRAFT_129629 [Auricularia subglabra TFB-10046 SS5]
MADNLHVDVDSSLDSAASSLILVPAAQPSCATKLAPEMWCDIWSLLEQHELVRVTHVCSYWRSQALGCALLWSHIKFLAVIHLKCIGRSCHCRTGRKAGNNLAQVREWLVRSKEAPLSVGLCFYPAVFAFEGYQQVGFFQKLGREVGDAFSPHHRRLQSLTFVFGDPIFETCFFDRIGKFPALSYLRLVSPPTNIWALSCFLPRKVSFPALREFVADECSWIGGPPTLPSLETLSCLVEYARSLSSIVSQYRNLKVLDVALLIPHDGNLGSSVIDPQSLAIGLESITFRNVSSAWEPIIAPLVRKASLKSVRLAYSPDIQDDMPAVGDLFAGVGHDLHLLVEDSKDDLTVTAIDAHSITRSLSLPRAIATMPIDALKLGWTRLPFTSLRTITLPWILRAAVVAFDIYAPHLALIRLIVGATLVGDADHVPAAGRPSFPILTDLTLIADGGVTLEVPRAKVDSFVAAISSAPVSIELSGVLLV